MGGALQPDREAEVQKWGHEWFSNVGRQWGKGRGKRNLNYKEGI